ncbi:MAG: FAD-linked oxidase C-terminal domain-containing protein [Candidatus Zixiibacteriota bacterium]
MPLDRDVIRILEDGFPDAVLHSDSDNFGEYLHDATEIDHTPDLVVFPRSCSQVSRLVQLANKHAFIVVARGAGTGFSGGAVATHGGVIVSIEKMNRILEIDAQNRSATVETGVITYDLDQAANRHGLFYPPDPASHRESTLGGNLAECAGGLRCLKYGVTKDYVLGLEYVDYEGNIHRTGSMSDTSESLDLASLLTGSEGTLGIVTSTQLRLLPMPESRMTFLYTFRDEVDAARAVSEIRRSGILPCAMEFMDRGAIGPVVAHLKLADMQSSTAMLLIELDGSDDDVRRDVAALMPLVRRFNPIIQRQAADDNERESLWQIRRELSTVVKALSKVKTSEDVCVPISKFADLVAEIQSIGSKHGLQTGSFGHAGDGNLHVCFIIPELTDEVRSAIEVAKAQLLRATLALGGTISGEHGIGFTKKKYLSEELGDDGIELLRIIKQSFDPGGIINPGKII